MLIVAEQMVVSRLDSILAANPYPAWRSPPAPYPFLRKKIQPPPRPAGRPDPGRTRRRPTWADSLSALRYSRLALIITTKREPAMAEGNQEKRREAARKAAAARSPAARREAALKGAAKRSHEERSEASRKAAATRSPEARREAAQKAAAARSLEQRRQAAQKAAAAKSPEARREAALKGAATRKRNREAKTSVGRAPGL
jgi:hypothetical protein